MQICYTHTVQTWKWSTASNQCIIVEKIHTMSTNRSTSGYTILISFYSLIAYKTKPLARSTFIFTRSNLCSALNKAYIIWLDHTIGVHISILHGILNCQENVAHCSPKISNTDRRRFNLLQKDLYQQFMKDIDLPLQHNIIQFSKRSNPSITLVPEQKSETNKKFDHINALNPDPSTK